MREFNHYENAPVSYNWQLQTVFSRLPDFTGFGAGVMIQSMKQISYHLSIAEFPGNGKTGEPNCGASILAPRPRSRFVRLPSLM